MNGQLLVVREVSPTGKVRLECPVRKTSIYFAVHELVSMRMNGEVMPLSSAPKHVPTGRPCLHQLTNEQRLRVARRISYARVAAPLGPMGPKNPLLAQVIAEVAERLKDKAPPSAASVYRWVRRYRDSGYDTAVFVQDAGAIRQRRLRIDVTTRQLLEERLAALLAANKGATLSGVMNTALAQVAKEAGYPTFTTIGGEQLFPDEFLARPGKNGSAETPRGVAR